MDFEDLDDILLLDSPADASETIAWTILCGAEKTAILKDICFDLDYICVSGPVSMLFECASVQTLVAASSGSIRSNCFAASVRNRESRKFLVVAEVGDFRLAVEVERDNEEFQNRVDSALSTSFMKGINITWRQVQDEIKSLFPNETLALYRFGQKQDLTSVLDVITGFSKNLLVNCAVGLEVGFPGHALFATSHGRKNSEFFHLFLSKIVGNILIKEEATASKLIRRSHWLCAYNTSQHIRKNINYQLKIGTDQKDEKSSREILLENAEGKIVEVAEELLRSFRQTKFRLESYSELRRNEDYGRQMDNMQKELMMCFLEKIRITRASCNEIEEFIRNFSELLKTLARRRAEDRCDFSNIYCFLQMYAQFLAAFDSEKKTSACLSYGLPRLNFAEKSNIMSPEGILNISNADFLKWRNLFQCTDETHETALDAFLRLIHVKELSLREDISLSLKACSYIDLTSSCFKVCLYKN